YDLVSHGLSPYLRGTRPFALIWAIMLRFIGQVFNDIRFTITADFIAYAIRSHWHIETKLHWQLESVLVKTDSA
ncbi:hypothetical protein KKJ23_27335, partial [Xenorhabdus bovienii]|nr:hypothetical protein [Xenorhabdus bovienii]